MAEKKVRNGFVAKMITGIYGVVSAIFYAIILFGAGEGDFYGPVLVVCALLYGALIAFAILGKKKKLYHTLFVVVWLVSLVALIATGAWGYMGGIGGMAILVIFGLFGSIRGGKVFKKAAE